MLVVEDGSAEIARTFASRHFGPRTARRPSWGDPGNNPAPSDFCAKSLIAAPCEYGQQVNYNWHPPCEEVESIHPEWLHSVKAWLLTSPRKATRSHESLARAALAGDRYPPQGCSPCWAERRWH